MNTNDRSEPDATGAPLGSPFPHPDWAHGTDPGRRAGAGSAVGRRSLIRRLASRSKEILGLWLFLSVPVAYLIYALVERTFEAVSLLRAEPAPAVLFGPDARSDTRSDDGRSYLLTQIQLLKSDRVLDAALSREEIRHLKMVASSKDARADLRRDLAVTIVGDNTYLIQVMLSSNDPREAAAIVNAVVEAYIEQHNRYQQTANRTLKKSFEIEREKLRKQIQYASEALRKLLAEERVRAGNRVVIGPDGKQDGGSVEAMLLTQDLQHLKRLQETITPRLAQLDFEIGQEAYRIEVQDKAAVPKVPSSDRRIAYTASASALIYLIILGAFLVHEIAGWRPAEPNAAS